MNSKRNVALQVLALVAVASSAGGCQFYNCYNTAQRNRSPSNDAIEKAALKLAGGQGRDCGRSFQMYAVADYDRRSKRMSVDTCAIESFKAKRPFMAIHDFANSADGINFKGSSTHREAYVLTPQGQLWRLATVSTTTGEKPIASRKITRLIASKMMGNSVWEMRYE